MPEQKSRQMTGVQAICDAPTVVQTV